MPNSSDKLINSGSKLLAPINKLSRATQTQKYQWGKHKFLVFYSCWSDVLERVRQSDFQQSVKLKRPLYVKRLNPQDRYASSPVAKLFCPVWRSVNMPSTTNYTRETARMTYVWNVVSDVLWFVFFYGWGTGWNVKRTKQKLNKQRVIHYVIWCVMWSTTFHIISDMCSWCTRKNQFITGLVLLVQIILPISSFIYILHPINFFNIIPGLV